VQIKRRRKRSESEKTRAAVGAGSKIVQVTKPIVMALAGHGGVLQAGIARMPENGMYTPPANAGSCGLRFFHGVGEEGGGPIYPPGSRPHSVASGLTTVRPPRNPAILPSGYSNHDGEHTSHGRGFSDRGFLDWRQFHVRCGGEPYERRPAQLCLERREPAQLDGGRGLQLRWRRPTGQACS
jgi:hypothetical protein